MMWNWIQSWFQRIATSIQVPDPVVGSRWYMESEDPFSDPVVVKVLAIKRDWVQYANVYDGHTSNFTRTLKISTFYNVYKRLV